MCTLFSENKAEIHADAVVPMAAAEKDGGHSSGDGEALQRPRTAELCHFL